MLAPRECKRRSVDTAIAVLEEALERYRHIRRIIYANKRDKKGRAKHRFEEFCRANGIKHVLCKCNRSRSNGKIEKWIHAYKRILLADSAYDSEQIFKACFERDLTPVIKPRKNSKKGRFRRRASASPVKCAASGVWQKACSEL